jgi:hypothetical protein
VEPAYPISKKTGRGLAAPQGTGPSPSFIHTYTSSSQPQPQPQPLLPLLSALSSELGHLTRKMFQTQVGTKTELVCPNAFSVEGAGAAGALENGNGGPGPERADHRTGFGRIESRCAHIEFQGNAICSCPIARRPSVPPAQLLPYPPESFGM